MCVSLSVVSDSVWPHGLDPTRRLCPWDSAGKNTGVGGRAHTWLHPPLPSCVYTLASHLLLCPNPVLILISVVFGHLLLRMKKYLIYIHVFSFLFIHCAAKLLQSCSTLCDPIDGSPPGSPIPGIFQARTLEWVTISFSNAWKWKVKVKSLSHVRLFATPWTAAYQAPPSMGFSRQKYWSGVPLPSLIYSLYFYVNIYVFKCNIYSI